MSDDGELLARYVSNGDQPAFGELVARHINLVYATALRRVGGDVHLAQDITQTVFSTLAGRARVLPYTIVLAGWLHETTRFAAAKAVRTERRRQAREQEALTMQAHDATSATVLDWERLSSVLDAALGELRVADRDVLLLRFFEDKDLRAVGKALGVSEDAAQKRVSRALEKLRTLLGRRGLALSSVALLAALAQGAVQAAPPGLASTVAHASLAGASAATWMGKLVQALAAAKANLVVPAVGVIALTALLVVQPRAEQAPLAASSTNAFHPILLERFYQRALTNYNRSQSWGIVPRGVVEFEGVPFRMFGKIEMNGMSASRDRSFHPPRVGRISVNRRAARLHLLGAAGYKDPDGTPVAELRLYYSNGQHRNIFIHYGQHVRNMHAAPDEQRTDLSDPRAAMVWNDTTEGNNPEEFRLFKSIFDNPLPAEEIESMEVLSLFGKSFLSLCAITLEEATANAPAAPAATEDPDDSPYRRESLVRVVDAQSSQPIANAFLALTVTDRDRTYGFGRYRSDARGQIVVDYPPGRFPVVQWQLAAPGYVSMVEEQTNAEGLLPAEFQLACTAAPPGTAFIPPPAQPARSPTRVTEAVDPPPTIISPRGINPGRVQSNPAPRMSAAFKVAAISFGLLWLLGAAVGLVWGIRTVPTKPTLGWIIIAAASLQFPLVTITALGFLFWLAR